MRHFLFYLDVLLRRHEVVHGEAEFLGFEAFTRPIDTNAESAEPAGSKRAKPGSPSSSDEHFLKAA